MNSSYLKSYHDLAFTEKVNYLSFIHKLGEKGLKDFFKFPGHNFSFWWFSIMTDKSPLKSDTYERLISFLLSTKETESCRTDPENDNLRLKLKRLFIYQFLKGYYELAVFFLKVFRIKLSMRNLTSRVKKIADQEYFIISYFPAINKDTVKNGVFENRYLGSFHKILDERLKDKYSHILLQVYFDSYNLEDSIDLARIFSQKQSVFFLEEFFKPRHLPRFIFYYLYFNITFLAGLRRIKKNMLYEYEGGKYNVWRLFKTDFYRSFCGDNLVSSLWSILLFRELVGYFKRKSKIICVCEMQPWEKAVYIFAKERDLTTIGVQHTIVPELLLQYFNAPQEIEGKDFLKYCPVPDYLATVGKTTAGLFKKYGWQEKKVFVWGAQRFEPIKKISEPVKSRDDTGNYIVCAFSIGIREAKRMLLLLKEAFRGDLSYKILLKPHPSLKLEKLIRQMGLKFDPVIFEYIDSSLTEAVCRAKGIITTESSSCLYALACNIPVIIPRFFGMVDCNPLSYISDVPLYVYSAEELRSACNKISASSVSDEYRHKCREFLNDYLYFPERKEELLEKIAVLE